LTFLFFSPKGVNQVADNRQSIFDVRVGDVVELFDPDWDNYFHYTYNGIVNRKHCFVPQNDPDGEHITFRYTNFQDVLHRDAKIAGEICAEYFVPNNCYLYNSFSYPNAVIVPIDSVFSKNPNDMGANENERMASIQRATFLPPINVKRDGDMYEIVNGNHRFRFSLDRFTHIPVIIC
jgi:hypothetical protein